MDWCGLYWELSDKIGVGNDGNVWNYEIYEFGWKQGRCLQNGWTQIIENLELSVEQFRKTQKSKRIYRISPNVSSPNPLQLTPDSSRDAAEPLLLLGAEAFDSPVSWFGSNPTINKIYWVEGSLR